jgi:lipopolysaccharide export system permease protein
MRIRLTAIETYVLGQTLISILGAMAILSSLILLIDFVDVAARVDLSFLGIARLVAMKSPAVIVLVLPFMLLFGTLFAFVGLNRRSELVAMRAAGVSAWRFIMPAALTAFVFGVVTIAVLDPITSQLNAKYIQAMIELKADPAAKAGNDVWLRQGGEGGRARTQTVIHAVSMDASSPDVRLSNVSFFVFELGENGVASFQRRIDAASATLKVGAWSLSNVRETSPGSQVMHSDTMTLPTQISNRREVERFSSPTTISLWALPGFIDQTERAGFSSLGYRLRLQQLLAIPLLYAAMSILTAAFSLKLMRSGGLAILATSGVLLGFVFFFFDQVAVALGQAEWIPVFAAAWAPPLLALLSGLTLLCYTEDG